MRLEKLKKDFPETPGFIHQMIQEEVETQLKEDKKTVRISARRVKGRILRNASVAAACILTVSAAVYAGTRVYSMYLEKQGSYKVAAKITSDNNGKINLPEKIHDVKIEAGYLPEGMEWEDEKHAGYPTTPNLGGFSIVDVLLDSGDLDTVLQETDVVESEQRTFGTREGIYLRYQDLFQDGSFNQRIYLLCPEEYRVVTIYVGDDVSKEEAVKFAENITLTETDTMIETEGLYTWSDHIMPEIDTCETCTMVPEKDLKIWKAGDSVKIGGSGESEDGGYIELDNIYVRLDEIQVMDDLSLLDEESIPEEWKSAVGSDGKLVENTLSYIKSGDGVETVDEIVRTESVKQKLVYASVTYGNRTDTEINHMLYLGALVSLNHDNGQYQIYATNMTPGEDYDFIRGDSVAHTGEMTYFGLKDNYGNGGNYIPALKPGESVQVKMAWIVNEKELEDLYLDLSGTGACLEFTEAALQCGYFDIH